MGKEQAMEYHYKMEELVPIVGKLAQRYTAGESTSVTYEKAEQLMGAVLYCIREAAYAKRENGSYETGSESGACGVNSDSGGNEGAGEKAADCDDEGCRMECTEPGGHSCEKGQQKYDILAGQEKLSAQQAYERGLACVEQKVRAALSLYNELMTAFDSYGNRCLYDTVVKGMPEFFKWYDMRFAPQDTILTLDYPVLKDLSGDAGVDRIFGFLECIRLEQRFLRRFPKEYVRKALKEYGGGHGDEAENLCGIVLEAAVKGLLGEGSQAAYLADSVGEAALRLKYANLRR